MFLLVKNEISNALQRRNQNSHYYYNGLCVQKKTMY
jgi:hypothetical protein